MTDLIRFIRNSAGISQNEFAAELHVAFATVNRWENGKTVPSPSAQKALYDFCLHREIDIVDFIIDGLMREKQFIESAHPDVKVLFHGSKSGIEGDILPISRPQCDFGKGFYMGTDIMQPLTLICNYKNPFLYFVAIDEKNLDVLELPTDISWAFVVAYNRGRLDRVKGTPLYGKYTELLRGRDLIIGDIADDRMFYVLDNFFEGNITDRGLVECLSTLQLGRQFVAVSQRACQRVKILRAHALSELELMALKDISEKKRQTGIERANEICRQHRRDGKFFDELLEEGK